ncbi:hypothetical protein AB0I10_18870 [Streptomyces sp. NPDC050636]|uniref:hypothetical protein n=1 Tax=Streptomyces sp. NPDC050636 TaxID=3154510 RepID=UPI0034156677
MAADSGGRSRSRSTGSPSASAVGSWGGRLPALDRETYEQRNTAERRTNRPHAAVRGLVARYDTTATIYRAGLRLAGVFICSAR